MTSSRLTARRPLRSATSWGCQLTRLWRQFGSVANILAVLCSEYRRAVAAERRYGELQRANALMPTRNISLTSRGACSWSCMRVRRA